MSKSSLSVGIGKVFVALAFATACAPGWSATLCVNPGGTAGCQSTIGAAVTAAAPGDTIQVAAGTYKEDVDITKSLALIGAGSATTIIDATGLTNGINVDGSAAAPKSGVSNVVISGFTVENANFQGIIVQNASFVTVYDNQVLSNNTSLVTTGAEPTCPGLPAALAAGEGQDCGEGINLSGADHSVVSNNVVQHNSGGILISDDTGAVHDNVISNNLVSDNGRACGITMASHSGMGVYHNTVVGNQSLRNGLLAPGEGAGIGVYAAGPGAQTYSNVVINNQIMNNGLPGVAMHNHAAPPGAPPVVFNDNMIVGNTISQNGADVQDTATPGPTGINIASQTTMNGTVIALNLIGQESIGIGYRSPGQATAVLNNLIAGTGIQNTGSGTLSALEDWFGCAGGPSSPACSRITGSLNVAPWLTAPFTSTALPSAPSGSGTTPPATGITIVITSTGGSTSATNNFQTTSGQISLDASQSTSSNPGALSFSWKTAPGYPTLAIPGGSSATPTVQLPNTGTYQLILTVTDASGATAMATVTIQYP